MPHPIVRLNHAVAVGMATAPAEGLELVDRLAALGELRNHHLVHATRADLLRRLGRNAEAAATYRDAVGCSPSAAERRYLVRRLNDAAGDAPANAEGTLETLRKVCSQASSRPRNLGTDRRRHGRQRRATRPVGSPPRVQMHRHSAPAVRNGPLEARTREDRWRVGFMRWSGGCGRSGGALGRGCRSRGSCTIGGCGCGWCRGTASRSRRRGSDADVLGALSVRGRARAA
jgi:hypothetical protein